MIKGKLVVVSNLTTFKTIQQSSDPIPDSAIVFIKNEGQIWTKGSYFGVQKTYDVVSKTDAGLAPKGGDSASSLIANVDDEWVLTVTNGANPSWRKLPANAFKNQTYTFYNLAFKNSSGTTVDTYKPSTSPSKSVKAGTNVKISASSNTITISATDTTYNAFTGASDSVDGSLGLVPKPTKGNQSKFLKADGSWATPTDTTYPIVSSTKDGLVPKFDANDGTIDQLDKDWVLTNNNGSIGWYKLPANAFNNSTYSLVNNSSNGLVPILPTTNSTTISIQADEWVLTTTKGGEPSWRKLPTTAFYSLPTAKTNALGGIKVGSVSKSAFADLTGKYYTVSVDKNGVAYVNVPWTDTPYTLPTASSTLGGVKTTSTVSSTTGLTACPIIDGVVYYKDSDSNTWRGIYVGGTSKMGTANNTKALNFAAGNNVTISYAAPGTASGQSGNASYGTLTINATNTWTAWKGATSSANGTAGYMPAPTSALRNQFLRGDGTWQSLNNYSLPTASSSTLGGVKTGAAITDTTGYTPVHIKDGVIYYKGSSTGYLPLSGGTIKSTTVPQLTLQGDSTDAYITYKTTLNTSDAAHSGLVNFPNTGTSASFGVSDRIVFPFSGGMYYRNGYNGDNQVILHAGNISSYNAGSANYLRTQYSNSSSWYDDFLFYCKWATDNGNILDLKCDNYYTRVDFAKQLNTARTIWGQSFDGTGNVNGILTLNYNSSTAGIELTRAGSNECSIAFNNGYGRSVIGSWGGATTLWIQAVGNVISANMTTGNVGIGTISPSKKLHVNGTGCFDGVLTINHNTTNSENPGFIINRNTSGDTVKICNTSTSKCYIRGSIGFPNLENNPGMGWHVFPENSQWTNSLGNTSSSYNISTGSVTFGSWNDTAMPLYVDITNKMVGIGTVTPSYKLHVQGSMAAETVSVSNSATGMFVNRTHETGNPHITFMRNGTALGDLGFSAVNNPVYYDNSTSKWKNLITESNYNSYSPTLTGGGASGTWGINISGTANRATVLDATSTGDLNTPSHWTYDNHYVSYDLYNRTASNIPVGQDNANSVLTFYKGRHGTSGAYATQIAFPNSEDIYIRKCSYGTWGSWRKLYHSGNFSATGTTWNGGTVSNTIYTTATPGMIVRRPDGLVPYIRFGHTNGSDYGELGSTSSGTPVWWYTAGENSAWRELVSNVSGTAYNSARWGGYSISVSGTPSNSTITFYV